MQEKTTDASHLSSSLNSQSFLYHAAQPSHIGGCVLSIGFPVDDDRWAFVPSHPLSLETSFGHVAKPFGGICFALCLPYCIPFIVAEPVHEMCVVYAFSGVSKSLFMQRAVGLYLVLT